MQRSIKGICRMRENISLNEDKLNTQNIHFLCFLKQVSLIMDLWLTIAVLENSENLSAFLYC